MIPKILISPSLKVRVEEMGIILSESGLTNPHPDLLYFPADSKLGIEQARKIKEHFSFKPYSAKGKAVVLEDATNLTIAAQNALLKILEESSPGAIIMLGATSDAAFLPTILSRCQIIHLQDPPSHPSPPSEVRYYQDIAGLLRSDMPTRFAYIEKLTDREQFLKALVSYFHHQLTEPDTHARLNLVRLKEFLGELLRAQQWAKHSVNIRAILEYLMLVMPSA